MSTLSQISVGHQPTSVGGLFVRDVPLSVLEGFQQRTSEMGEEEDGDTASVVFEMFEVFLCGEDGSKFEDINSADDVRNLGILTIKAIMEAVQEVLDVSGKDS